MDHAPKCFAKFEQILIIQFNRLGGGGFSIKTLQYWVMPFVWASGGTPQGTFFSGFGSGVIENVFFFCKINSHLVLAAISQGYFFICVLYELTSNSQFYYFSYNSYLVFKV